MFDISEHVNADGTFIEGTNLHTLAGEDYKESQALADVKDFPTLVKVAIDSKTAASKKLENVIQKPAEGASEDIIKQYQAGLRKELGLQTVSKPEEYEFKAPEIPEELKGVLNYDPELENYYRNMFFEAGAPKSLAEQIFISESQKMIDTAKAEMEEAKRVHEEKVTQLKTEFVGENLPVMARIAHDALMEFGGDDVKGQDGQTVKGIKSILKELNIYSDPTNFDNWLKAGIDTDQLRLWHRIGLKMQSGTIEAGDRIKKNEVNADVAFINKVNAQTPEFQIKG